jgi:hypothetical protein
LLGILLAFQRLEKIEEELNSIVLTHPDRDYFLDQVAYLIRDVVSNFSVSLKKERVEIITKWLELKGGNRTGIP